MRDHIKNDLHELHRALEVWDPNYAPAERMIRQPFRSPGYHTTLKADFVHPTRSALDYALALLDSGEPDRLDRAVDILDRLLALQDADPESRTYGIWSWFLEEPLERMSPPDWNWADFCGTRLIEMAMDHRDRLPEEIAQRLDEGTVHAARSIKRRDVGPGYTNIALMGTHVTYAVGEFYGHQELLTYARQRLQRFYEATRELGAFAEYNSPTYTAVAIRILARMQRDIRDPEARPLVDWVYDLAWDDVSAHFHPPTRQWSGPHARCYSTLLQDNTLAFLQRALGDDVRVLEGELPPDLEANRLDWPCPTEYASRFGTLDEPRELAKVYRRGEAPVIGYTYMDPTVSIGSAGRAFFWNQQRPVVAYWGDHQRPIALQVRFLHDGYDYSSALILTRQRGPFVLAAVVFATDGGDTHPGLDRVRDAQIGAEDLRLRLQIMGMPADAQLPRCLAIGEPTSFAVGNACLGLHVARAVFGDLSPHAEAHQVEGDGCLDVVLYQGPRREISFGEIDEAVIAFGLQVTPAPDESGLPAVEVSESEDSLKAAWETASGLMELTVPVRPGPMAEVNHAVRGVDGVPG